MNEVIGIKPIPSNLTYGKIKKRPVVERRRIQATAAGRYRLASLHVDILEPEEDCGDGLLAIPFTYYHYYCHYLSHSTCSHSSTSVDTQIHMSTSTSQSMT